MMDKTALHIVQKDAIWKFIKNVRLVSVSNIFFYSDFNVKNVKVVVQAPVAKVNWNLVKRIA